MTRVALALVVLVGCGSPEAAPGAPPAPLPVPAPIADPCAPFTARAHTIAASEGACTTDADCACRSGLLFGDCGAVTTLAVATALAPVLTDSAAAGCVPDGPRCGPRECRAVCSAGRCAEAPIIP